MKKIGEFVNIQLFDRNNSYDWRFIYVLNQKVAEFNASEDRIF